MGIIIRCWTKNGGRIETGGFLISYDLDTQGTFGREDVCKRRTRTCKVSAAAPNPLFPFFFVFLLAQSNDDEIMKHVTWNLKP